MGLFNLFKPARTVLIIDCISLNESLGMKGKVAPRNQLQTLRRLARFAQREKIEVVAVLTGTPLNKAPAGKKFEDIVVLYSKSPEQHAAFLCRTARSKGGGAVLVTGSKDVENKFGSSERTLRVSTFRKTFDSCNENDTSDRGNNNNNNNGGGGRSGRQPRRRQPKQQPKAESRPPRKQKEKSQNDAINELIDLVD